MTALTYYQSSAAMFFEQLKQKEVIKEVLMLSEVD
jgi:hypothetical protein